jgi:mono/diheme cytochrome c family protein
MMRLALVLTTLTVAVVLSVSTGSSLVFAAAGSAEVVVAVQDNPIEMSDESIAAGRRVYGRFCRSCHGLSADGAGMTAPPGSMPANLVDDEWDHGSTDGEIFTVIKEGVAPKFDMDAWEGRVTDDDIWHVINFLRDLASE